MCVYIYIYIKEQNRNSSEAYDRGRQMRQRCSQLCIEHNCAALVTGDAALGHSPTSAQRGWLILQPLFSCSRVGRFWAVM